MRQSERWALLGNAVTVPVAKWLGEQLANPYRHKYCTGARDRRMDSVPNPSPNPTTGPPDAAAGDGGEAVSDAAPRDGGRVRISGAHARDGGDSGGGGEKPWYWDEEDFVDDGDMFEYKVLTRMAGERPAPTCAHCSDYA